MTEKQKQRRLEIDTARSERRYPLTFSSAEEKQAAIDQAKKRRSGSLNNYLLNLLHQDLRRQNDEA